jgi:hypothetical protein
VWAQRLLKFASGDGSPAGLRFNPARHRRVITIQDRAEINFDHNYRKSEWVASVEADRLGLTSPTEPRISMREGH